MEKLQQDSPTSPEQHLADVSGALAQATGESNQENPFVGEAVTGSIFSPNTSLLIKTAFLAAGADKDAAPASLFVGGGVQRGKTAPRQNNALGMPMTYAEKVTAEQTRGKGLSLAERCAITNQQVGKNAVPIINLKATTADAKALNVQALKDELDVAMRALVNRYENSTRLLQEEALRGREGAVELVQSKPEIAAKILPPQMQAATAPKMDL